MGLCLEDYRRKIGMYNTRFRTRNSMVPKRQSRVTIEPRPALTAIVLVCCAVAALGWADYSAKPLADLCGNSVTSHVNMPTDFSWVFMYKFVIQFYFVQFISLTFNRLICLNRGSV